MQRNLYFIRVQVLNTHYCASALLKTAEHYTVELLFNVPQFKVFLHLTFKYNDPRSTILVTFPPFKIFLSLVFKSSASQRNVKWRFHDTD
jgi:hypothetical protein